MNNPPLINGEKPKEDLNYLEDEAFSITTQDPTVTSSLVSVIILW